MTTGKWLAAITLAASLVQITLAHHTTASSAEQPPTPNVPRAIGYDDRRMQRVMMIGGATDFTNQDLDKVWSWSTTRWELLTPAGPPSRANGAAAFDATAGRGVIAGGAVKWLGDQFRAGGDTWLGTECCACPRSPARDHHSMVTDGRGQVLMFGGIPADRSAPWPADTWELKDGKWLRVATEGPAGRARTAMAYDSRRRQVVLFGGVSAQQSAKDPQTFLNDTWIWESGKWRKAAEAGRADVQPRARHGLRRAGRRGRALWRRRGTQGRAARRHVAVGRRAVERDQDDRSDTWGDRDQPLMVYDVKHEKIVLYGSLVDFKDDTWEWDGKRWIEVRP